jgi:hypothetical protein
MNFATLSEDVFSRLQVATCGRDMNIQDKRYLEIWSSAPPPPPMSATDAF